MEPPVMQTEDKCVLSLADSSRRLDQSLQHRLQLGSRLADDLEYVAGRGLIFERLLQIAGAPPQVVEKARILDGDHRLVGEGSDECNLLLGEPLDPRASEEQPAKDGLLAEK